MVRVHLTYFFVCGKHHRRTRPQGGRTHLDSGSGDTVSTVAASLGLTGHDHPGARESECSGGTLPDQGPDLPLRVRLTHQGAGRANEWQIHATQVPALSHLTYGVGSVDPRGDGRNGGGATSVSHPTHTHLTSAG